MSDLATVQQLAERVSQMGYPPFPYKEVFLNDSFHDNLSMVEKDTLEDFFTACFNARHELREFHGGYTEEDISSTHTRAYEEGYNDGVIEAGDEDYNRGYEDGYEKAFSRYAE